MISKYTKSAFFIKYVFCSLKRISRSCNDRTRLSCTGLRILPHIGTKLNGLRLGVLSYDGCRVEVIVL